MKELWKEVGKINKEYFPDNKLMPILGNGETRKPKIMFVFINPTHLNISSKPSWKGPRYPFIGTKSVWRVFHKAGVLSDALMRRIENNEWSTEFAEELLFFLKSKSFYLTNLVKWTGSNAALPDSRKINLFLPILEKEIEIVKPEFIVTFGLIPFKALAKQEIRLKDYYEEAMKKKKLRVFETRIKSHESKIIPCYFPVGRGEPGKAKDLLRMVNII